jgi:hypothetical protein
LQLALNNSLRGTSLDGITSSQVTPVEAPSL